ncbi:hypothetical protein RSSM_03349 [Rhodopirellula sallentina SM41]|uniref:Uncharacterized protein n=2 Tax=Rhodopirellula TaxID=265488 RepID=M5U195_9BACT|nr:hypothetical protein RSSM_03349 [Rhodopirellula sallentina SM41]
MYQESDVEWYPAVSEGDAIGEREDFLRHIQEMEADGESSQDGVNDVQELLNDAPHEFLDEESFIRYMQEEADRSQAKRRLQLKADKVDGVNWRKEGF